MPLENDLVYILNKLKETDDLAKQRMDEQSKRLDLQWEAMKKLMEVVGEAVKKLDDIEKYLAKGGRNE
jgi:hypothetical protein